MRAADRAGLWTPRYGLLFAGQAVSAVGSQVTFLALPLIAVLSLGATPAAMGILGALDNLPYLLLGLVVGVLVDRLRRRRLMIAADLARGVAVASVPLTALFGWLSFPQLCVVAFVVGAGNIAFDVACQAHLPELVDRTRLVDANAALQTSASLSAVGAPGLVGVLIQSVGAPVAMLVDAGSYLVSAITVGAISQPEQPRPAADRVSWREVTDGLRVIVGDRRLTGLAGGAAMLSIGLNALFAVLVYHLAAGWGFGPLAIGLVFLTFGLGGALGALGASAAAGRMGVGAVLAGGPLLAALGLALVTAIAPSGPGWSMVALFGGAALSGTGLLAYQVLAAGLRQGLVPDELRGRVLGTMRFVEWGAMPLGSVIGGWIGEVAGAVPALGLAAVLVAGCTVWTLATGLRAVQEMPDVPPPSVDTVCR